MENFEFIKNKQLKEIERLQEELTKKVEGEITFFKSNTDRGITSDSLRNLITGLSMALQMSSKIEGKLDTINYVDMMKSE